MIYFEAAALILVVVLVAMSDLIYLPRIWIVVGVVVIALVADGFLTASGLYRALNSSRADLEQGTRSLLNGAYADARQNFLNAGTAAGSADALQVHPAFWIASHIPWLDRDPKALVALIQAAGISSQAGLVAVQGVQAMGAPAGGLASAIYRHAQVNLNASQRGEPFLIDIEDLLGQAYSDLRGAPQPLLDPVQNAMATARTRVLGARDSIHKVAALVQALPSVFGRDRPRHYLLVFQNPGVPSGLGGPVDFYGTLTADSGALRVGLISPIGDLPTSTADPATAAAWFRRAYGSGRALDRWNGITRSPTFDAVAPVMQSLYESATGNSVDGVVAFDPVALGRMTSAVGSVHQAGYNARINKHNAVRILTHDVFVHFAGDKPARDDYIAGLIEQVWKRVANGGARSQPLSRALGDSSRGGHFKMFTADNSDESSLTQVGIGGSLATVPDTQMVVTNDRSSGRLGYFIDRKIRTVVRLARDGEAFVTTVLGLHNRAPSGPASVLLGQTAPGVDRAALSFILPARAHIQSVSSRGHTLRYDLTHEANNPRATLPVTIPPGGKIRVTCSYRIPGAVDRLGADNRAFRLSLVPQPSANPDHISVTVVPPNGFGVVESLSAGGILHGDSYVSRGSPGSLQQLLVGLAPS